MRKMIRASLLAIAVWSSKMASPAASKVNLLCLGSLILYCSGLTLITAHLPSVGIHGGA
jgi:hypothetical protein